MISPAKLLTFLIVLCAVTCAAQTTKRKAGTKKTTKAAVTTPTPKPADVQTEIVPADQPAKKNNRDAGPTGTKVSSTVKTVFGAEYSYTFDRPGFSYSHIVIEHDDSGKGKIVMKKEGYDEAFTDPIELTAGTLENLKKAFTALDFVNSHEEYQYAAHDYSNMGNVAITLTKDGHTRTTKFNWTENKDAKSLMDEYRRISNEYTWRFEMQSARENQTLLTPGLVESFASYIDRNEISDPGHLVPLLTQLSLDERLPLLARNRIKKIIVKITKEAK